MVASGLTAFASAQPQSPHAETSETAERATAQSRQMQGAEFLNPHRLGRNRSEHLAAATMNLSLSYRTHGSTS